MVNFIKLIFWQSALLFIKLLPINILAVLVLAVLSLFISGFWVIAVIYTSIQVVIFLLLFFLVSDPIMSRKTEV